MQFENICAIFVTEVVSKPVKSKFFNSLQFINIRDISSTLEVINFSFVIIILSKYWQLLNIQDIFNTLLVMKFDISKTSVKPHPLNIEFISVTFFVSKFDKSNRFKSLHNSNILFIVITLSVLNEPKFND